MAVDMNIDLGEVFKNLLSKKNASSSGGGGKKPNDPFTKVIITGSVAFLFGLFYLFFIYFPAQEENQIKEQKVSQINDLGVCIAELSEKVVIEGKGLASAQARYEELTRLFHTGQELDDLYRHISMLALSNQLMVSKIKKAGENPVFEISASSSNDDVMMDTPPPPSPMPNIDGAVDLSSNMSVCDKIQGDDMPPPMERGVLSNGGMQDGVMPPDINEENDAPKKVAYYELKVEFEIKGNYANYTNFRKGLAKLKKIININEEKIVVLESKTKKGEVKVRAILAIYRMPSNESEKYARSVEGELL
ncbi:MAG TPA: hypothetical protein EYG05_00885 [Candidatus Thioglobus autotrophicus]|jgi:Tfp pilus assembly protein PilO|nr:hypothetical protein [Candidatus Thioglobus autotrophicus]